MLMEETLHSLWVMMLVPALTDSWAPPRSTSEKTSAQNFAEKLL
jgi:hypothetical protein